MTLSLMHIVCIALAAVAAYYGVKWGFKKDTEVEHRRRAAGRLAAKLQEMGFKDLPELFIDYSVGDYSGMAAKLRSVAQKMMGGEKAVLSELEDVFGKLLKIKLTTAEGRFLVQSELEAMEKMLAGPSVPAAPAVPVEPAPVAPVEPPVAP